MKEKLFKPVYWIMLILLSIDFIDTNIRIIGGHLSGSGIEFPGFEFNIQLSSVDFIIFIIAQLILAYCIYQLFKLKRAGGYIFMITNVVFLFFGFELKSIMPLAHLVSQIHLAIRLNLLLSIETKIYA